MKSFLKKVWISIATGLFSLALLFGALSLPASSPDAVAASTDLTVQKTNFLEGEAINVTAYGSGTDWVGIYREGETLSAKWYYVKDVGNGATVNLTTLSANNNTGNGISATLSAGNYTVYLVRNDGAYTSAEVAIPITISLMCVDKTEFSLREPIYVSATHPDDQAWVGLYRSTESNYCRWYYVSSAVGTPYDITQGEKNIEASFSPNVMRGDYFLRLFDNNNAVVEEIAISVVGDPTVPSAPLSATYDLSNPSSGFATGTVSVKMPTSDLTNRCIALFWGNEDGVFEDYSYIKFKVTGETSTFTFGKNVLIPYGATKLYVYAKNTNGDALSTGFVTVDLPKNAATKNPLGTSTGESFWVISDTHVDEQVNHVHNQHFANLLGDIARIDGDAMSLIVNGDMVNHGLDSEYVNFQNIYNAATGVPPMVLSIGNHDYYNQSYDYATDRFFDYAKYPNGTSVETIHFDYWQNGYHFIFLGTDEYPVYGTHAVLSQTTLTWLDNKLDEGKDEHKPTFLFLHQPLYDTVAGSRPGEDYSGVETTSEAALRTILADHPEVMLFCGHTHWTMNAEANMYEGTESLPAKIFNTSSAGYLWTTYDNASGDYLYGSEGYYLRVDGSTLYVLGYDFVSDTWISAAQYCVELNPAPTHTCTDADDDHLCDTCDEPLSTCADTDGDHLCDTCDTKLSECQDTDGDHLCDTCDTRLSNCLDKNNDHYCNTCGEKVSDCIDENDNHKCDCCHKDMGEHTQAQGKYVCNYCKQLVANSASHTCAVAAPPTSPENSADTTPNGSKDAPDAPNGCNGSISGAATILGGVCLALLCFKRKEY